MVYDLLPMAANSIHWRSVVIEDVNSSEKCIHDLLLPIKVPMNNSDPSFLDHFGEHSALERLCLLTTFLSKVNTLIAHSLAEFQNTSSIIL